MRKSLTLILIACDLAAAQPVFEVASIKVREGAPQWTVRTAGTRLTMESYSLFGLVKEAYNLQNYQFDYANAPAVVRSGETVYDIAAKAADGTTPTRYDFRVMLQTLLADRFQLKVHHELREMPIYALVVVKTGVKFKESAPDADPIAHIGFKDDSREYSLITAPKITMEGLANLLSPVDERPVINKTGLTGNFNIRLYNTPWFRMSRGGDPNPGEISVMTAVQEQLGLRLDPQKAMMDVMVVDHAESPTSN